MPEFTPEQLGIIRFCLDNWDKISMLINCGMFDGDLALASIQDNFKLNGELQNRHYHFTLIKENKSYPKVAVAKKSSCAMLVATI